MSPMERCPSCEGPLVAIEGNGTMPVCDHCDLGFPVVQRPRLPANRRKFVSPILELLVPQAFLALVWKIGNKIDGKRVLALTVDEVDDTGGRLLNLELDEKARVFRFIAEKKQ